MPDQAVVGLPESAFVRALYSDECLATMERWEGIEVKPDPENRKKREGIRIFRNDFVEGFFSKSHPVMPIVWTAPMIGYGLYRGIAGGPGGPVGTVGLFLGGMFLWTLLEYVLHRHLFHWKSKGPGGKVLSFMLHGYHHEFPDDKMRLVAPPLMLFSLGCAAWFLYRLVFGAALAPQVFAGTAAGYVAYDWAHYYTHHFHPKAGLGNWLRRYHLKHHFQEGEQRFGISSPLWDIVFRTYVSPNK